jgi:hypothetical protein
VRCCTNLWLVPAVEVIAAVALFAGTTLRDRAACRGTPCSRKIRYVTSSAAPEKMISDVAYYRHDCSDSGLTPMMR